MSCKEPNEDNGSPSTATVSGPVTTKGTDDASDNEMTGCHANSSNNEDGLSSEAVDVEYGGDGENEFQDSDNSGSQQGSGAATETKAIENLWSA